MTYYNTTNITTANSFLGQVSAVNDITNGMFGGFLLLLLFLIFFVMMKHHNTKIVLIADNLVCAIIAICLWAVGWISVTILIWPIILTLVSIVVYLFTK